MSKPKLIDERKYPLNVESHEKDMLPFYRWEHRATVAHKGKRFLVMLDNLEGTVFVEDISSGEAKTIKDEDLFEALVEFAYEKGLLELQLPIFKPSHERFI